MTAAAVFLRARSISQVYTTAGGPVPVLRDINVAIEKNSFNIIFGPSGSGKSTLINILSGLLPPSSGEVFVKGEDMYAWSPDRIAGFRAKTLGVVYQTNYWVRALTVVENVALSLFFLGHGKDEATKIAREWLKKVGMEDYADKQPTQLSGGEQQRVSMARALSTNPELIVADEPTGNLDTKNSDMIMSLLQQCQSDFDQTVILVTHDLKYLPLADNLFHIKDGTVNKVEQRGTAGVKNLIDDLMQGAEAVAKTKGKSS